MSLPERRELTVPDGSLGERALLHVLLAHARDQDIRSQIRAILLEAQPKMVAIESLHPISMMASARGTTTAPGKNVAAKRKLNESLAESAIGHVGKLLREEAAKFGIPTISVPQRGHVPDLPALRGPAPE